MAASQSNLSDPKFGYDLVVAATQLSINATMDAYLSGIAAPDVVQCYVYDNDNNLVPIDYDELKKQAKGSDPFAVPDGANPSTNQDLINLNNANFAGAFRASVGLPQIPPDQLPPVVTLSGGTQAPVLFNLLCSDFAIVGFYATPRAVTWLNKTQASGSGAIPWYFSANVKLNSQGVTPSTPTTNAVQARFAQLQSTGDPFSIQQLFLQLDTAIAVSSPQIEGINPGWPVWILISQVFIGAYVKQCAASGQPVLGYSVVVPTAAPSSINVGAITEECCALLDANGNPIPNPTPAQQDAATFDYLGTAATTAPTAVQFPWNWVELADTGNFAGVQAVRRGVFLDFLLGIVNAPIGGLSVHSVISLSHDGEEFSIDYSYDLDANPSLFVAIDPPQPGDDGFIELATISYTSPGPTYDSSEDAMHMESINGTFIYSLSGSIAVSGNQLRLVVHPIVNGDFNTHYFGDKYVNLYPANYVDITQTTVYELAVDAQGQLNATASTTTSDNSATFSWSTAPIDPGSSTVQNAFAGILQQVKDYLASALPSYAQQVTNFINGQQGWAFPGADSFVFSDVYFSTAGADLITEITYASPSFRNRMQARAPQEALHA